jgi:hypothetical protein
VGVVGTHTTLPRNSAPNGAFTLAPVVAASYFFLIRGTLSAARLWRNFSSRVDGPVAGATCRHGYGGRCQRLCAFDACALPFGLIVEGSAPAVRALAAAGPVLPEVM